MLIKMVVVVMVHDDDDDGDEDDDDGDHNDDGDNFSDLTGRRLPHPAHQPRHRLDHLPWKWIGW